MLVYIIIYNNESRLAHNSTVVFWCLGENKSNKVYYYATEKITKTRFLRLRPRNLGVIKRSPPPLDRIKTPLKEEAKGFESYVTG